MKSVQTLYFPHDRYKSLILLLLVALIYLPFIKNPLIFDDLGLLGGGAVSTYADALFNFDFRWFPYTTLGVTWVFFGEDPLVFRIQNLLLHGLNVLMLLLVLRVWIALFVAEPARQKMANWGAWLGALVFACHPLAVYGTGYLIQRSILMATLFTLLMHLAYFRGLLDGDKRYAALAVAAYFLAVFSKEHSLLVPAILLPLTWVLRAQIKLPTRALLSMWLGFAAIALLVLLRAKGVLGQAYEKDAAILFGQDEMLKGVPMLHFLSLLNQAGLFFKYCLLMIVPNPAWMSIDMREPFVLDLYDWRGWTGGIAFILYGIAAFWCLFKSKRLVLLGLALLYPWLLFLTEFSSIRVQEVFVLYRTYLWLPGYMLLLPLLVSILPTYSFPFFRERGVEFKFILAGATIALLLVPLSWNRLWVFADNYRLWDDAIQLLHGENRLGSHRTFFNRARASEEKGNWEAAITDYKKSLSINSSYTEVNIALGRVLTKTRRFQEALVEYDSVILKEPKNAAAYFGKGFVLNNLHDTQGALQQIKKSCELGNQQACLITAMSPQTKRYANSVSSVPPRSP